VNGQAGSRTPLLNADRAAAYLEEAGLDALVGASQANVYYLTGYHCWLEPLMRSWMTQSGSSPHRAQESFAILPRGGRPALVAGTVFAPDALASWADEVWIVGRLDWDDALPPGELDARVANVHQAQRSPAGGDAVAALAAALRDLGLGDVRLGVDAGGMEPATLEGLRAALPQAELLDCTSLLRLVRMVKTQAELDLLARSAALNERAGVAAARAAAPGVSVAELLDGFRRTAASEGADFDHCSPAIGGIGLSSSTGHVLSAGEIFCLDYGCVLGGYFSDAGLTVALGELPEPLPERYEALRDAIVEVGLGAMGPGVRASSVHHAMVDYLAERSITACFPHGHGLGLELRDYPILVPDTGLRISDGCVDRPADLPLEPGMVINLEVSIFVPGRAALEVEITTLVTERGARPFVPQDRSAPIRPG
jgi:Xaa-Pro aminopeptidase